MGIFDFLSKKRSDGGGAADRKGAGRDISRLAKLAGEKMAQNYDRQEAIEELGKLGTAEAARALLRRFSFTMEPSITDQEEKEAAAEGIVAAGTAAIEPIREYCARAEGLTWPLKVLKRIVAEDQMVTELLQLLDQFDTEYMRNPEPKIQLIGVLEAYPSAAVRQGVEPFLTDVNEPVRFHAAVTTFGMNDGASIPALIDALEQEESLRVKNRVAAGLAEKQWEVPESLLARCRAALPPGYSVSGNQVRPA